MNWIDILASLGIFTLGSVTITGLIVFFGKRLFEQYLKKRLQEQTIRFSKLHNDRAEVIRILFQKLARMERSMRFYVFPAHFAGDPDRNVKRIKAGTAANEFFDFFYENEVFFDDPLCKTINEINDLYRGAWVDITGYDKELVETKDTRGPLSKSALEDMQNALTKIEAKIPPVKQRLKSQLQELLGIS